MRRMILTSLVLLPVMAHAQASTLIGPKPFTSSANVQAELTQPIAPMNLSMAAAASKASKAASMAASGTSNHAALREFIQTRTTENFADAAMNRGGTLEFSMMGSAPSESSAPAGLAFLPAIFWRIAALVPASTQ